jgi:hypothetical protein
MTPLLLTAWSVVAAQETPERAPQSAEDDAPLALPVDEVHAPAPGVPARQPGTPPERPLAIPRGGNEPPQRSAARLQALKQYQRERVSVGTELAFHSGGAPVRVGFGGPWYGMGWGMFVANPTIYTSRTDAVYKGTSRLDMPDFLGTVGARDLRADLERDILRANRSSNVWNTVVGLGIAGVVVGSFGYSEAEYVRDRDAMIYYNQIALGGLTATIGGLIGSSVASSRSFRLRRNPSYSIGFSEAEQLAEEHNERLRQGLGLTADDVWGVESQGQVNR